MCFRMLFSHLLPRAILLSQPVPAGESAKGVIIMGVVTDDLAACIDSNGNIDYRKFYTLHPKSRALTAAFETLRKSRYVEYETDDDGIVDDFDITGKFLREIVGLDIR